MRKILPEDAALIPGQATRVFKGVIFDVYQWEQELFDGTHATFERLRRPDTVQVIGIVDNKVIVLNEQQPAAPGRRDFPGGRVDPGEAWLAAAQREMREETGLSFANWRLVYVQQPASKIEWFIATFLATDVTAEIAPTPEAGERITIDRLDFATFKKEIDEGSQAYTRHLDVLLDSLQTLDDLKSFPEFIGQEVDR